MQENYLMGAAANEETILYGIPISLFNSIILNYPKVSQFLIASFATNTRDPFSDKHKGKLFANVSSIQKVENSFAETQSAKYSKNPITCSVETSIKEASSIMTKHIINSIIVAKDNIPIGIITDKVIINGTKNASCFFIIFLITDLLNLNTDFKPIKRDTLCYILYN